MHPRSPAPWAKRSRAVKLLACTLVFGVSAFCARGHAQSQNDRPSRLPAFGRSVAGTDDSSALLTNPANLVFMPGSELRWSGVYLDEDATVPWQGHAFSLALPLPLIPVATGLRVDLVDPPAGAREALFIDRPYQFVTWGLGFGSETASFGISLQNSYSDSFLQNGLTSWTLALTNRPFDFLGLSFVAHDINGPRNEAGVEIDPSYVIAAAVRPLSQRALEISLEGRYVAAARDYFVPRGVLTVDLPFLGRLYGDVSVVDPSERIGQRAFLASLGLSVFLSGSSGSFGAGAGSVLGNALGADVRYRAHKNLYSEVVTRSFREPVGPELPRYALRIRIEETPSARQHVALLRGLWGLARDEPSIHAVVLEVRTAPAASLAHIQELRDALYYLRKNGKRVLCHLEDATGSSLYLCAAADRTLLNPAGGVRFAGLRTRHLYFRTLLENLGIRADFVRIGAHKGAPEQYMRDRASDTIRSDRIEMLQILEQQLVLDIARDRRIAPTELRQRIATGPFIATEAHAAGLVDGYAFDDQLGDEISKLAGKDLTLLDDRRAARAPERFGNVGRIAVIYLEGDMVDGRSETIPFLGMKLAGSYTIADALKQAREDPQIRAVVFRIETGGGSAMAADVIYRQVELTAAVKPVIVSMGSAAASGGYYASAAATRILANPATITGSIGIFYGKADVAELFRRIGVFVEVYKTAPRADAESIFFPFSESERKELERKVGQFYDMFLTRVASGRKLTKEEVDRVGQGKVWLGSQAASRKLVDQVGGLRQALELARAAGGLPEYAPIIELPPTQTTLLGRLLGIEGINAASESPAVPAELFEVVRALAPFAIHPADKPLARIELSLP